MLRTRENSDVFNTLDEIYLVFTSKSKYPLCSMNNSDFQIIAALTHFGKDVDSLRTFSDTIKIPFAISSL